MQYNLLVSFGDIISYIGYILLAVFVLLVMITVHEFGHFISGKLLGFKIEEFSVGFGPKLFSREKKNGEVFSLRAIPLGGFCAFYGEDEDNPDEDAFNKKAPWKRIIVLISGALMNYILAILVIIIIFTCYGHTAVMAYDTKDGGVLKDRDVILSVEDKNIYLLTDLIVALDGKEQGEEVTFEIYREGEIINVEVPISYNGEFENLEDIESLSKVIGLNVTLKDGKIDYGFRTTRIKVGFFEATGKSFDYSFKLAGMVFTVLRQLLNGSLGLNSVGGTVTTITMTADAVRVGGLWSLLNIVALIGVNLAVFNLLPFPALDGSRVIFAVIEWIFKKPVNRKVESAIHTIGLFLILVFAVFVDLQRCF